MNGRGRSAILASSDACFAENRGIEFMQFSELVDKIPVSGPAERGIGTEMCGVGRLVLPRAGRSHDV